MRISTCEFLRLSTQTSWFYKSPGVWISDRGTHTAKADGPDAVRIYTHVGHYCKTLTYFRGMSSNDCRAANKKG